MLSSNKGPVSPDQFGVLNVMGSWEPPRALENWIRYNGRESAENRTSLVPPFPEQHVQVFR